MRHPEPGAFFERLSDVSFNHRPCLFLDRDGVSVEETNYLHRVEDVAIIQGVAESIALANAAGVAVVMVTNQAGIGRGYYSWRQFYLVQEHILGRAGVVGATYDAICACAYHPDGKPPFAVAEHAWRKPNPGMLLHAASVLGVDLTRSHIVGDTLNDLTAGARAGLPSGTLVATGHGEREWQQGGAAGFAELEAAGFRPRRAPNAGEAIAAWLATLTA